MDGALALIDEGEAVFAALRTPASTQVTAEGSYRWHPGQPEETLRDDVRSLLNAIESKSNYFDRVNASKKKIQQTFAVPDFMALSEILQIRRDFWAASEIFLMDDIRDLGPELADAQTFETFQTEARTLLFKDEGILALETENQDPVDLRLAIAREDAVAFKAKVEAAIAAELEKSRFPTASEIVSVPWSAVKGIAVAVRETRYLLGDAVATAQSLARAVTEKGLKGAAEELRRTRGDLSGQFATAFERAGGLAREGGGGLKRHYEFVLEAQELRARYAELLARAPHVSEKGKQFLARLELERRAEQFRTSSGDAADWARQKLVVGIAHLIAGLQYAQAKITPPEHKQLVARPPESGVPVDPPPAKAKEPLRVLLLPASAYEGGNHGRGGGDQAPRKESARPSQKSKANSAEAEAGDARKTGRLRDLVTGEATVLDANLTTAELPRPKKKGKETKPRFSHSEGLKKTSFKDLLAETAGEPQTDEASEILTARDVKKDFKRDIHGNLGSSLLDRLSSVEAAEDQPKQAEVKPQAVQSKPKQRSFGLFRSKSK